jgi:M6 family metalloprotease-like protein
LTVKRVMSLAGILWLATAAAPALAQDAPPRPGFIHATDARTVALAESPLDRAQGFVTELARRTPWTRGLAPPTTGELRLAVVLVELADSPRPPFGPDAWERALFSTKTYTGRGPGGEPLFGSVRDYYLEQSSGRLALTGHVFDWIKIGARRAELESKTSTSLSGQRALYSSALDALLAREGPRALDDFDALAFVVSGKQAATWGSILWPHSGALVLRGRPWRYYLMHSGTDRFEPIGTHAHELGHVLGLPDKYGPGRRSGCGIFCLMAQGNFGGIDRWIPVGAPPLAPLEALRREARAKLEEGLDGFLNRILEPRRGVAPLFEAPERRDDGVANEDDASFCDLPPEPAPGPGAPASPARPLHLCAVCKIALGWTRPVALDASRRQSLYLEAIEDHPSDVVVLPLGSSSERAVLEYRGRRGFDAGLPRSGLLVWRAGLPGLALRELAFTSNAELVAAHGIASVDAAHRGPDAVMFPWGERREVLLEPRLRCSAKVGVRISAIEEEGGRLYLTVESDGN